MRQIIDLARKIRSAIVKTLFPKNGYFLFAQTGRTTQPLSAKFGFDRGTPIDRHYIEAFMEENKQDVKGRCLEVHDDNYTVRFGGDKVTARDVLDIDTGNKLANIHGDLRKLENVPSETYNTLIITQTIGLIDDVSAAVGECYRILKPGGVLLITGSAISPYIETAGCWRFTPTSFRYLLHKHFNPSKVTIKTYGNVLSGQAFWVGAAQEELTRDELDHNDPRYPIIVAAKATK